jgi:hypothetical protein
MKISQAGLAVFLTSIAVCALLQFCAHMESELGPATLAIPMCILGYGLLAAKLEGGFKSHIGSRVYALGVITGVVGLLAASFSLPELTSRLVVGNATAATGRTTDAVLQGLLGMGPVIAAKFLGPIIAGMVFYASITSSSSEDGLSLRDADSLGKLAKSLEQVLRGSQLPPLMHQLLTDVHDVVSQWDAARKRMAEFAQQAEAAVRSLSGELQSLSQQTSALGCETAALSGSLASVRGELTQLKGASGELRQSVGEIHQVVEDFVAVTRSQLLESFEGA